MITDSIIYYTGAPLLGNPIVGTDYIGCRKTYVHKLMSR